MNGAAAAVVVGVCLVAGALGWLRHFYRTVRVDGSSMQPILRAGDVVLLARRRGHSVRSGQIVVVEQPVRTEAGWYWRRHVKQRWPRRHNDREWSVKRAVATAGEPVPSDLLHAVGASPSTCVPTGTLLVLGDHGAVSIDSRQWGYVPADRVLGVVIRSLVGRGQSFN